MVAAEPDPLGRDETEAERADRNFNDILQELRVTQTGVQVLFSLLLTVPFSQRFDKVTSFQRDLYFVALLLAAATASTLVAPVSIHRLLFRTGEKPWVVTVSSRCAVAGTILLLLTFTSVLLLVTDVLFALPAAASVAGCFLVLSALLWFLPPLLRRRGAKTS
ncbi:MAG: hypothetical protein QOE99_2459 [Actinomycetota bacterium]|jgi:hypothetical protein|nr:hypothetical protein [Actinomycetota bacterium]